jgi:hypothetical protein
MKVDAEAMRQNEVTLSLRLRSANLSDAGEYRAVATNIAGTTASSSVLTVNSKSASYFNIVRETTLLFKKEKKLNAASCERVAVKLNANKSVNKSRMNCLYIGYHIIVYAAGTRR